MKTRHVLLPAIIASFFLFSACSDEDEVAPEVEVTSQETLEGESAFSHKSAAVNNEYSQAQQAVLETFGEIGRIITEGAGKGYNSEYMDELISYHGYGDKFVEFNGGLAFDSEGNEHNERQLFGEDIEIGGVTQFAAKEGSMKVAVYYGNVANLTFISDFILEHKEYGTITVENLITLLFVKTKGKWVLVHEHHSPAAAGS